MSPYLACDHGHDEVRWAWTGGYNCWFCGSPGRKAYGLTITSTLLRIDDDPYGVVAPHEAA